MPSAAYESISVPHRRLSWMASTACSSSAPPAPRRSSTPPPPAIRSAPPEAAQEVGAEAARETGGIRVTVDLVVEAAAKDVLDGRRHVVALRGYTSFATS